MRLRILAAACALAAAWRPLPAPAEGLTIVSRGGAWQEAQREVLFRPFADSTGIPVRDLSWEGGIGTLRQRAESGQGGWDLVEVEGADLLQACAEGLVEKLDWPAIGGRDHYQPAGVSECGVGAGMYGVVLAWDRDKLQAAPTWADFWDVAKYPGRRGLRRSVRTNLEIALLADGVAPGDVYRTLRTDDGVERAFRKLDQLKPYVLWWESGTQAAQILATGDVLMTAAPNGRVVAAARSLGRNFGLQWAGGLIAVDFWAILHGSPAVAEATRFLAYAGDPARETELQRRIPIAGLAKGAGEGLPPEVLEVSPNNPANQKAALVVDDAFWRDNQDRLGQRFNAWLAR